MLLKNLKAVCTSSRLKETPNIFEVENYLSDEDDFKDETGY